MKLLNPTSAELKAVFATRVARMTPPSTPSGKWIDNETNQWLDALPPWTESVDAVLPWLEKPFDDGRLWSVAIHKSVVDCAWRVTIREGMKYSSDIPEYTGLDPVLAKAAVIALLRANGVEVEFTP